MFSGVFSDAPKYTPSFRFTQLHGNRRDWTIRKGQTGWRSAGKPRGYWIWFMALDDIRQKITARKRLIFIVWCPGSDSNRHASRRGILSPLRLPISPPGQVMKKRHYRHFSTFVKFFTCISAVLPFKTVFSMAIKPQPCSTISPFGWSKPPVVRWWSLNLCIL